MNGSFYRGAMRHLGTCEQLRHMAIQFIIHAGHLIKKRHMIWWARRPNQQ